MCKQGGHLYLQFNIETDQKKTDIGYKRYSIAELDNLLSEAGFQIVKSDETDILEDYAYIVSRKV